MSAISGFINTIRNAVYGEQVRGAIINALEQCYSDVESPSLNQAAFTAAINAAYAGGILDIVTVTQISAMTNQQIIYRYNGTQAGYQKGLYYYSPLSSSWVLIGSEIHAVSTAAQMTDANAIYKYTGTQSGMMQNSLYCYNGTAWVPIGSGLLTASTAAQMTNQNAIYKYTGSESGYYTNALYYHDGTAWVILANMSTVESIDEKFNCLLNAKEIPLISGYFGNSSATTIAISGRYTSTRYSSALVSVKEGERYIVSGVSGSTDPYAWAITTSNGTIIEASDLGGAIVENEIVEIPSGVNAKYLVINQRGTRKSFRADTLKSFMENVDKYVDGTMFYLKDIYQGSYASAGGFTNASNRIRSAIIPVSEGTKIRFTAGAKIREMLYGFSESGYSYSDSRWYEGSADITFQYSGYVILVFRTATQSDITPSDYDAEVLITSGTGGKEVEPQTYPELVGIKRAEQYANLRWTPKVKVPQQGGANYFPANTERVGMLYSEAFRIGKVVGFDVSLRTFMTALNDPYSLIYTENINADHSKSSYGITYNGNGNAGAYYGISCDEFISSVLGCKIQYHNGDILGWANDAGIFETIYDQSANGLKLLDVLSKAGSGNHGLVVTGLRKNKGATTSVKLSESIGTGVHSMTLSAAGFNSYIRTGGYTIVRYNGLYKNINYEPQNGFVAVDDEELDPYVYNDDICTFAGDYACFEEGDLLYIDYTKGSYTSMQIYKNDTLLETITLSSDSSVHQVNLSEKGYTYGKYKARLTNGTNNSEYCYWEILNCSASVEGNVLTATSANATPLYWGWVNSSRNSAQKYEFNGETTADISAPHNSGYDNLVIVFQGDYGRIRKYIVNG